MQLEWADGSSAEFTGRAKGEGASDPELRLLAAEPDLSADLQAQLLDSGAALNPPGTWSEQWTGAGMTSRITWTALLEERGDLRRLSVVGTLPLNGFTDSRLFAQALWEEQ